MTKNIFQHQKYTAVTTRPVTVNNKSINAMINSNEFNDFSSNRNVLTGTCLFVCFPAMSCSCYQKGQMKKRHIHSTKI